jgi:hypothetical protein
VISDEDRHEDARESRTSPPGEGERRAIGGYYPQYRVAAALILRGLRDGTLEAIRLADPKAGRVDDFQIIGRGKCDAFQIKWSRYGEPPLTFRELTTPDGSSPPLIAQLGDGWQRLRAANPEIRVVIHLTTNRRPSANDRLPESSRHNAAFIQEVWQSVRHHRENESWQPPPTFAEAWNVFQRASGLNAFEFARFVKDCELEFGYELPGADASLTLDSQIFAQDLQQLTESLLAAVSDPIHIVELTRDDLLARLGWRAGRVPKPARVPARRGAIRANRGQCCGLP